jgi:hypothetical protein
MTLEPLWIPSGDFQPRRCCPGRIGNWTAHLPFAFDLVGAVRPHLFVELGTHYGESYFGFCQSVAEHNCPCVCYAVDTWLGEEQSGFYDESVYSEVNAYNQTNYSRFSYLLRTTFDEATKSFADDSIDILHIDGLHTYDAVSHDFYNWLPKVRGGGIVLLHDIVARHGNFGVWKLWEELAPLGHCFLFTHSWGLGVFRKPFVPPSAPDRVSSLFDSVPTYQTHVRRYYSLAGLKLQYFACSREESGKLLASASKLVEAQIFPLINGQYSLERHASVSFAPGQWQKIECDLPFGLGEGSLRLDLSHEPCILDVAAIYLRKTIQGDVIWFVTGNDVAKLQPAGDLRTIEQSNQSEFVRFLSIGNDPQLMLPDMGALPLDGPMRLECWVRAVVDPASLLREIESLYSEQPVGTMEANDKTKEALVALRQDHDRLERDYAFLKEENASLLLRQQATDIQMEFLQHSCRKLQGDLYVAKTDVQIAEEEIASTRAALDQVVHARNIEAQKCNSLQATLESILRSRSWRITAPLRRVFGKGAH